VERVQGPELGLRRITLDREPPALLSTRSHSKGEQCRDAFSDRCAESTHRSTASKESTRRLFPQVKTDIVGLAGLEPAASSLSAKCR
jgi:hypothetical protein